MKRQTDEHRPKNTWGSPRAFAEWLACLALLFAAIAFHSRFASRALTAAVVALWMVSSLVILWRLLRRRPDDPPVAMGQMAALPRRWRRWVLGERDSGDR
jgi:hypothetical protein